MTRTTTQKRKILVRFQRFLCEGMSPRTERLPVRCLADYSASIGSEEESGKDWDELEEEARKGERPPSKHFRFCFSQLAL